MQWEVKWNVYVFNKHTSFYSGIIIASMCGFHVSGMTPQGGLTPAQSVASGQTPMRTPSVRDKLNINPDDIDYDDSNFGKFAQVIPSTPLTMVTVTLTFNPSMHFHTHIVS